jgi:hypothetical protein
MTAPYGFKFAHTFDGGSNASIKILPVSSPGTGGIAVGDPVTVSSGFAKCAVGGDAVYGVCVSVGKTTGATQTPIPVGGDLVNATDPATQVLATGDTGFVAVVVADNAVFESVYIGVTEGGTAPTYAAAIGSAADIGNYASGTAATFDAAAAHIGGGISKLGVTTDGTGPNSDVIIQGIAAAGGTLSTRSLPTTYPKTSGSVTAGDVLLVTFNNVQFNPV